ncbi:hypothetical protein EDC04DRAFT_2906432 [Pisolithus marmoratus]|nr:hypothetical protein EDC04DRAFT_2906432 [Pisolithus marmoratus]
MTTSFVMEALETLLLRSSAEATPFLSSIIQTGIQYIKYNTNYTRGDKDKEMAEADKDYKDEDLDDQSVKSISHSFPY